MVATVMGVMVVGSSPDTGLAVVCPLDLLAASVPNTVSWVCGVAEAL